MVVLQVGWHNAEEATVIQKLGLKWYSKVSNTCPKSSLVQRKPSRLRHHHAHSKSNSHNINTYRLTSSHKCASAQIMGAATIVCSKGREEGGNYEVGYEKYCESRIIK